MCGGGGAGIRTQGRVAPSAVFKTAPFDRSGTPPRSGIVEAAGRRRDGHHRGVTSSDPAAATELVPAHESILRCTTPDCGTQVRVEPTQQAAPFCPACGAAVPWIVSALVETFDDEIAVELPVLVDFWAMWCTPCQQVTPLVMRAAKEHAGALKVVKVNVDRVPQIADRYVLKSIPTLSLLRGGSEADRLTGSIPPEHFASWLAQHVGDLRGA